MLAFAASLKHELFCLSDHETKAPNASSKAKALRSPVFIASHSAGMYSDSDILRGYHVYEDVCGFWLCPSIAV